MAAIEHKDGSAAASLNVDGSWMYERKLLPDEDEYFVRNNQVLQRVEECEKAYSLLKNFCHENDWKLFKPTEEFCQSFTKSSLDLENGCIISGHSFGSATSVMAMHTSK